jgi:fructose-specific phosphotransferase system IIC component
MKRAPIIRSMTGLAALLGCAVTGCSRAPTYDILGSLFPAWLVCLTAGILLTILARWLFLRAKIPIVYPILVYPSMTALFTFLLWLMIFG